jgi:hypothetical protein
MKRIWVVEDHAVTGGMVSTWGQSYGLSRDERTGRWTWYDRRDSRPYESRGDGSSGILTESFATTDELAGFLGDYAETDDILRWADANPCPAMEDLRRAALRAGEDSDDDGEDEREDKQDDQDPRTRVERLRDLYRRAANTSLFVLDE